MLFASGTLAVVMVAALVVSMTPRRSASPLAVSATTAPAGPSPDGAEADAASRIASFPAIPSAIAAVPVSTRRAEDAAAVLPDLDDEVLVVTDHVAYALAWREVAWLDVDDAIVLGADGAIVARFEDGRFVVTADAVVGAALTVTED